MRTNTAIKIAFTVVAIASLVVGVGCNSTPSLDVEATIQSSIKATVAVLQETKPTVTPIVVPSPTPMIREEPVPTATKTPVPTPTATPSPEPASTSTPTPSPTPTPRMLAEEFLTKGKELLGNGFVATAIDLFSKAIELWENYDEAYYQRGIAYFRSSNKEDAVSDLTKAILINPQVPDYWFQRGLVQSDCCPPLGPGTYQRATEDFTKAINLNQFEPYYYYHRGRALEQIFPREEVNSERAIEDYSRAINLDPQAKEFYVGRSDAFYLLDEYWKAIDDLSFAIVLDPADFELYKERGDLFKFMPVEQFEERNPGISPQQYVLKKMYQRATQDYDRAIELAPTWWLFDLHYNRGVVYGAMNWYDEALKDYNAALLYYDDALPSLRDLPTLYLNRGFAYESLGDGLSAYKDYNKAVELGMARDLVNSLIEFRRKDR